MLRRVSLTFFIISCLALSAGAVSLLDIQPEGRAAAMGDAPVSAAEGATAIWGNPAGLASGKVGSACFGSNQWIGGVTGTHVAGSLRWQNWGLGVTVREAGSEDLERRDTPSLLPQGSFGVRESDFGFGLAREISPKLRIGVSSTYRYNRIADDVADEWRYAVGAQYLIRPDLRTGVAMQYGNGGISTGKATFIPRVGVEYTYDLPAGTVLLGAGEIRVEESKLRIGTGLEFTMLHILSLRAGYQFGYDSQDVTYGVGAAWHHLKINLGIAPFDNDLGTTTRITVEFGA